MKIRQEATEENQYLICEVQRLKIEVTEYKRREYLWRKRWQRIAFHILQKGIQIHQVDAKPPESAELPLERETNKILVAFDKEIPSSGRI